MDKIRLREQLESLRGENFAIRWYGSRGISNDLAKILEEDEKIICAVDGCARSVLGFMKYGRLFRTYFVMTDRRLIYVENPVLLAKYLYFMLKRKIIYNLNDIWEIEKESGVVAVRLFFKSRITLRTSQGEKEYFICFEDGADSLIDHFGQWKEQNKIYLSVETKSQEERIGEREEEKIEENADTGSSPKKRFCTQCGNQVEEQWKFCPYCESEL